MKLQEGVERVLEGEPLDMLSAAYRDELLVEMGLDADEAEATTFAQETRRFMNSLCRQLGERHSGDARVAHALREWVWRVDDYDAFDALLSGFEFEGKARVIARGRALFPGPLTAHWDS